MEVLLKDAFDQYGVIGLLIVFFVVGPGFTYIRTRNTRNQMETRAQEIINQVFQEERQHADLLEERLNETQAKLETAKEEVFGLKYKLVQTEHCLEDLADLGQEVRELIKRFNQLEGLDDDG